MKIERVLIILLLKFILPHCDKQQREIDVIVIAKLATFKIRPFMPLLANQLRKGRARLEHIVNIIRLC